jgi:transcriptional regulator with XRE-family HTH domain
MPRKLNGTAIKAAREAEKLTPLEFAKVIGMKVSELLALEAGKSAASAQQQGMWAVRLGEFLDVDDVGVFYFPPDDTRYHGNQTRSSSSLGQRDHKALDELTGEQREMASLQQWLSQASLDEIKRSPNNLARLRELERTHNRGITSVSDDVFRSLGVPVPAAKSVAEYHAQHEANKLANAARLEQAAFEEAKKARTGRAS